MERNTEHYTVLTYVEYLAKLYETVCTPLPDEKRDPRTGERF